MRYPWKFWILYVGCVIAVAAALAALTHFALKIERAEAVAQRRAEQEERVSQALWRIDSEILAPIVAEQATLPAFFYEPIQPLAQTPPGKGSVSTFPRDYFVSPLLTEPSEFTLLHFQIDARGEVVSPQIPQRELIDADLAANPGLEQAQAKLPIYEARFEQLKPELDRDFLVGCLPAESLPPLANSVNATWTSFNGDFYRNNAYQEEELSPPVSPNGLEQQQQQAFEPGYGAYIQAPYETQQAVVAPNGPAQGDDAGQQAVSQPAAQQAAPAPRQAVQNDYGYAGRNQRVQYQAQLRQQAQDNFLEANDLTDLVESEFGAKGVSQALWLDGKLLLARRATKGNEIRIQGSWLDWDKLRARILEGVRDLLPNADVEPAVPGQGGDANRTSATLPLRLAVADPPTPIDWISPTRVSVVAAWVCYVAVAALAAYFLHGVIVLAERRAAFVSAVTHELRTPLTTLRMYAEMLSEDMVPDPERKRQYVRTLKLESDRLSHLVENVLAYARLERGRPTTALRALAAEELLEACRRPLAERASQSEMAWSVAIDPATAKTVCRTDPGIVEQILFNLVDNCCKYGATESSRRIDLVATRTPRGLEFAVSDCGPGVSPRQRAKLFRPFSKSDQEAARSAPGVGLGLALSRRMARQLGGDLVYRPLDRGGARFVLTLPTE